jgi:hypothetical protein
MHAGMAMDFKFIYVYYKMNYLALVTWTFKVVSYEIHTKTHKHTRT